MTNDVPHCVEHRWDDPLVDACEAAKCPCGHVVIDHEWNGCEVGCGCMRSPAHALLDSGVVTVKTKEADHA